MKPLSCPKCGAPLPVTDYRNIVICDHCSTPVEMAKAPGGQYIPQITETVDSVAIQARMRIIEGILKTQRAQLAPLEKQVNDQIDAYATPRTRQVTAIKSKMPAGCIWFCVGVGIIVIFVIQGNSEMFFMAFIGLAVVLIGIVLTIIRTARDKKISAEENAQIAAIENKINQFKEEKLIPVKELKKAIASLEFELQKEKWKQARLDEQIVGNSKNGQTNLGAPLPTRFRASSPQPRASRGGQLILIQTGHNKVDVIKVIREYSLTGISLAEAKALAENTPAVLMQSEDMDRLQLLQMDLEAQGAVVELRYF